MLSLKQVSLRRGHKLLFEDASFQLHRSHRMGLIGANGSGKTSLLSLLLGELEAESGVVQVSPGYRLAHVAQESLFDDKPALDYVMDGDHELREIQQSIRDAETSGRNEALHGLYERLETINGFAAPARSARLLHGLGFDNDAVHQPVKEFSGGWRMRLRLAQALMCRSDILLLDEPTNHLDLPAILWLERWLNRYEGILVLVSHDRDFLDAVCTRIAHIDRQQLRLYNGNYSDFEINRSEQLARQQAMYSRQQQEIRHIQSFVERFRYKASKARQAQSRLKMLERMQRIAPAHVDSPFHFEFMEPKKQVAQLLKLEEAVVGYQARPVLSKIDLNITAGDRIGLLGANGAGKSTLVKALCSGDTLLAGRRTIGRYTRIGYFAQHQVEWLSPEKSPLQHLEQLAPRDNETQRRNYLGRFGFEGDRIFDPVAPFSGGEKARLALALMIRQRPNLLLLDEPTNHLDLEMRQALSKALVEYSGALVVISHDRHLLRSVCDELLILHQGKVERFMQSLDDYPSWLRMQNEGQGEHRDATLRGGDHKNGNPVANRKESRRIEAERRSRLQPLQDRIRRIESDLADQRSELESIEYRLAREELYAEGGRKDELTRLMVGQGKARALIAKLEEQWLEASQELEQADS